MKFEEWEDPYYGIQSNNPFVIVPRKYLYCNECDGRWETLEEFEKDYKDKVREKMLKGLKVHIHRTEFEIINIDEKDERFKDCKSKEEVLDVVIKNKIKGRLFSEHHDYRLLSRGHTLVDQRIFGFGGV